MRTQEQFKETADECPVCGSDKISEVDYSFDFFAPFLLEECQVCDSRYYIMYEVKNYSILTSDFNVEDKIAELEEELARLKSI